MFIIEEKVVDLWGGYRDKRRKQYWEEDTLGFGVFGLQRNVITGIFNITSKGLLDFDEKVAAYWPDLTFNNKQEYYSSTIIGAPSEFINQ